MRARDLFRGPGGVMGGAGGPRGLRETSRGSHMANGLVWGVSWWFMRHLCLYIGVQIFIAYGRAGPPEVVQEALADLKRRKDIKTERWLYFHFPSCCSFVQSQCGKRAPGWHCVHCSLLVSTCTLVQSIRTQGQIYQDYFSFPSSWLFVHSQCGNLVDIVCIV